MKISSLNTIESAHDDSIWTATWVPSDAGPPYLLTGSLDECVRIWNPDTLENIHTNSGHCLGVVSVAVFDVVTNNTVATLEAPPSQVWQLNFNPQNFNSGCGRSSTAIKLWDTAQWQLIGTLSVPRPEGLKPSEKSNSKKFVLSVAWSVDGQRIACGSMDGTISIFDVARAKFLHHLEGHLHADAATLYSPRWCKVSFQHQAADILCMMQRKTLITSMSDKLQAGY
ncbi:hypothetical protein Leryth_002332 [Lithospermum erythrorhizon]|nr:hypothetical protein Leryth_002332 [Lithospermum erythrorhizon]